MQATLSALLPQSTYHFRLVASNAAGISLGTNRTFASLPGPSPVATTGPAENVKAKAAMLTGTVNTAGNPFTMAFFEWGLTTNYGNRVQVNLTTSATEQSVQATLSALLPQTTYHFRLMASNAAGLRLGSDQMFTSLPPITIVLTNYTEEDLRTAINSADVIRFAGDATINVTSLIDVTSPLTLDGGGNAVTMIGSGTNRFFSVRPGGNLQLIDLTLANGRDQGTNSTAAFTGHGEDAHAGAIEVEQGTLTAINCLFTNNAALGGSGSENASGHMGNTISVGHGGSALGAAIFARSSLVTLTNCTFANNQTVGGAGSKGTGSMPPWGFRHQSPSGYSKGGALYLSNCTAVLAQCSLEGNQSTTGSSYPDRSSGLGGAVYVERGSADFVSCSLIANLAAGDGGAIYHSAGSVTASLLELRSNVAVSPGIGSGAAICSSTGALTISDTTFESNQAFGGNAFVQPPSLRDWRPGQSGQGAALAILAGSASIERCYFGGNSVRGGNGARHGSLVFRLRVEAGSGVGGAVFNAGTTEILNSTFAQNTATPGLAYFESGGDILSPDDASASQGGAIANVGGSLEIQFSTIAQNSAARGIVTNQIGEPLGAGLFSTNGTLTLGNSILAWNSIDATNSANASGTILDAGNNLSSDSSFIFGAAGSVNNVDPLLGLLGDNGGPTLTFPLLPGSPAIDAANPVAPATDQRSVARPQGPAPDIGAFERQ